MKIGKPNGYVPAIFGVLCAIGLLFLFGWVVHTSFLIEPQTAIGIICLSAGLVFYICKKSYSSLIPLIVSFILLNITFLVWHSIKADQEAHLNDLLQTKTENMSSLIKIYLNERFTSFSRISYRWLSQEGGTPKSMWQADVTHYIHDQPGYVAIEWVDNNYTVRWVVPEQGNERVVGFNLYQDAHRRQEVELALKTKKLRLSNQMDLIQGGKGIILFSPLFKHKQFLGLMVGVINTGQLFDSLARKMDLQGIRLSIADKTGVMYTNLNNENGNYSSWKKEKTIDMHGQLWNISIEPLPSLYYEVVSPVLPWVTLVIGSLLALLSGILTQSFMSIRKLQTVARNANERLQGIIEGSADYIAAIDLNYNFIVFNTMYHNEIYRLFKIDLKPGMNFNVLLEHMHPENQKKQRLSGPKP